MVFQQNKCHILYRKCRKIAFIIKNITIYLVKADVSPFLVHPQETEIWSNDYFMQIADRIQIN